MVVGVCAVGMGEEGGGKLPFAVSKETTGIVEPLRGDGTVDYVGAMNEKYGKGVTKESNAFVGWLEVVGTGEDVLDPRTRDEVLKACGANPGEGMAHRSFSKFLMAEGFENQAWMRESETQMRALRRMWKKEEFPQMAAHLEEQGRYLDRVKEAFRRERFWAPCVAVQGHMGLTASFRSLTEMREVVNQFGGRATLRAKGGDFEGFLSDVSAIERIAMHLNRSGMPIDRLVAFSMMAVADRVIGAVAGSGMLTEKQCLKLWEVVDPVRNVEGSWEEVGGFVRWQLLDAAGLVARGQGNAVFEGEPFGAEKAMATWADLDRSAVDWDRVMKGLNESMDQVVAAMKIQPLEEMLAACEKIPHADLERPAASLEREKDETVAVYSLRVRDALLERFSGDMGRIEYLRRQTLMQNEIMGVVVVAAAYRDLKGKWPEALSDLVPGYLKKIPRDIYSEGGMREIGYSWSGDGVVVSSVGPFRDGKQTAIEVGVR